MKKIKQKNLSGATVEAFADSPGGLRSVSASLVDAENGIVRIHTPVKTFEQGIYDLQLRVTHGTKTETLKARVTVERSL